MRLLAFVTMAGLVIAGCGGDPAEKPRPQTEEEDAGEPGGAGGGGGGKGGSGAAGKGGSGAGGTGGSAPAGVDASAGEPADAGAKEAAPVIADAEAPADAAPMVAGDGGTSFPGAPGLMSIFDGKSLEGWQGSASVWSVRQGVLVGGGQRGQLTTRATYGTFRLVISMRLSRGDDHLGVCMWGTTRVFDCLLVVPPSGAIYDYVTNKTVRSIPYDPEAKRMWHQTEILANLQTGVVKVAVNGQARADYKDPIVARRKAGPIGLQLHSGGIEVEFKDIYIEADPKEDRLVTVKP